MKKVSHDPSGSYKSQDPTETGSTGEGAASALARMKTQHEHRRLRQPGTPPQDPPKPAPRKPR